LSACLIILPLVINGLISLALRLIVGEHTERLESFSC
jgi:hypothetical protein